MAFRTIDALLIVSSGTNSFNWIVIACAFIFSACLSIVKEAICTVTNSHSSVLNQRGRLDLAKASSSFSCSWREGLIFRPQSISQQLVKYPDMSHVRGDGDALSVMYLL